MFYTGRYGKFPRYLPKLMEKAAARNPEFSERVSIKSYTRATPFSWGLLQLVLTARAFAHTENVEFANLVGLYAISTGIVAKTTQVLTIYMKDYTDVVSALEGRVEEFAGEAVADRPAE
jgi:hypothetical protein